MARCVAEASGKESLDQFPGERGSDDFSSETKDVHVVVFDALVGGKHIVDEAGTDTCDFVRGDRRTDAAPAERYPAFYLMIAAMPAEHLRIHLAVLHFQFRISGMSWP
jgi:hypothetical protein